MPRVHATASSDKISYSRISPDTGYITNYTANSNGYDIRSSQEIKLKPGCRALIKTGIKLHMPVNVFARIESRSRPALHYGVVAFNGIIDSDFHHEIKVLLFHHGDKTFVVNKGDRIAQIVFLQSEKLDTHNYEAEEREGGFGSTNGFQRNEEIALESEDDDGTTEIPTKVGKYST